jgi:serine/threonine-protein kinase
MAKQAADRFAGAAAFLAALRHALEPAAPVAARGSAAAIHVAWHVEPALLEEPAVLDDLDSALEIARAALEAGARVVDRTGNTVVALLHLPHDAGAALGVRRRALDLARAVRDAVDRRPGADRRVRVSVSLTAGTATLAGEQLDGGEVAAYAGWTADEGAGIVTTAAAIAGLDVEASPLAGAKLRVR